MKMRVGLILLASVLLTGCYNRVQEYQPYSKFDERMAEAAQKEKVSKTAQQYVSGEAQDVNAVESEDMVATAFNDFDENPPKQMAQAGRSSEGEVAFDSASASKKPEPVNIGAL